MSKKSKFKKGDVVILKSDAKTKMRIVGFDNLGVGCVFIDETLPQNILIYEEESLKSYVEPLKKNDPDMAMGIYGNKGEE